MVFGTIVYWGIGLIVSYLLGFYIFLLGVGVWIGIYIGLVVAFIVYLW